LHGVSTRNGGSPTQSERLRIRRIQGADAQWLKSIFALGSLGSSVNRDYSARIHSMATELVAHQLSQQFALPPADIGALVLVIELANGERLGMASFVGIDEPNRRAEFIIGFPGVPPHSLLVFQAGLLLAELAFSRLRLHKVSAVLYGDNPRRPELEHMLSRLGFSSEGVQRQHVRLPGGEFVDVHLWGGLGVSVLQSQAVQKFTKRLLGQPRHEVPRLIP
jgi:RimJ/RimL family protein N-acetyltransferase